VALAHRHRQPARPAAVEVAETRVAVPVRVPLAVLLPQDRQRDVLALELAVDRRPVRLAVAAMALLAAGRAVQLLRQCLLARRVRQRPAQPCRAKPPQRLAHRRWRDPQAPRDLAP
jgi:hypothetical protein